MCLTYMRPEKKNEENSRNERKIDKLFKIRINHGGCLGVKGYLNF